MKTLKEHVQNGIKKFFFFLFDQIIPFRKDYKIIQNLTEEDVLALPRSERIEGFPWITALFTYKHGTVKAMVWELKYRQTTFSLEYVGKLLYEEILAVMSDISLFDVDAKFLLVPIPVSAERRQVRGYNQSEYIAKSILEHDLEHCLLYAPQWFEKIKDTPSQSHTTSKEDRHSNLQNCFKANPQVANYHVFLIDDVVTTGSTLSEAQHTLISAGARDVYAFTIAH